MIDGISDTTAALLGIGGLVAMIGGWVKWYRPIQKERTRDRIAQRDAIIGREPVIDSITGKELAPALPGIGQRMANQEQAMAEMTKAVAQLAETHMQMIRFDATLHDHEGRIKALEEAAVERVVSRAESTQAFRTIEAAIKATPDRIGDEPDL